MRKVALSLGNASFHNNRDSLPDLRNVKVVFLSPNNTVVMQPMDIGVIRALNVSADIFKCEDHWNLLIMISETNTKLIN